MQPASSAGAILCAMSGSGAFHGMIAPDDADRLAHEQAEPATAARRLGENGSSNG